MILVPLIRVLIQIRKDAPLFSIMVIKLEF